MAGFRFALLAALLAVGSAIQVGVGIGDATGPSNDYVMMGMANPSQKGTGIHTRMRARSFVFVGDDGARVAYCSLDAGMIGAVL